MPRSLWAPVRSAQVTTFGQYPFRLVGCMVIAAPMRRALDDAIGRRRVVGGDDMSLA